MKVNTEGLKMRKPQPKYLVLIGDRESCLEAARLLPGAKARKNGAKGWWILIVPRELSAEARQAA